MVFGGVFWAFTPSGLSVAWDVLPLRILGVSAINWERGGCSGKPGLLRRVVRQGFWGVFQSLCRVWRVGVGLMAEIQKNWAVFLNNGRIPPKSPGWACLDGEKGVWWLAASREQE
jgi:hypothetical protein